MTQKDENRRRQKNGKERCKHGESGTERFVDGQGVDGCNQGKNPTDLGEFWRFQWFLTTGGFGPDTKGNRDMGCGVGTT